MAFSASQPAYTAPADYIDCARSGDIAVNSPAPATWQRLLQIGTGHSLYAGFNHVFDYVLYPYVVYTLGMVVGGAIMTLASLLQCALTLVLYERMRIDWVGSGLIEDIARKQRRSIIDAAIVWIAQCNRTVTFFVLCALTDPFIVTAFFRGGSFNGLRRRDWQLFLGSVLVCNLYWIFVADLIGHGVATLSHWLQAVPG